VVDAADAGSRVVDLSAIVAAVNPRAANTSVAASRMRRCLASVFAQRRVGMSGSFSPGVLPRLLRGCGQSLVHLRGVRPPGTTCFAVLASPWSHASGISCLVGDVAEPIPAVDFRRQVDAMMMIIGLA